MGVSMFQKLYPDRDPEEINKAVRYALEGLIFSPLYFKLEGEPLVPGYPCHTARRIQAINSFVGKELSKQDT